MIQNTEGPPDSPELPSRIVSSRSLPVVYPRSLPTSSVVSAPSTRVNTPATDFIVYTPPAPSSREQISVSSKTLSNGFLSTKKRTLTILLVGETGVGKTVLLDLFANVLGGLGPTMYRAAHNIANEAGGSKIGSQTNEALLYEFESLNGVKIRLLDTPGLADTRGIEHDEKHKASIARVIRDIIPSIDGVLIVANGTTERLQVATDYAVTTLASIFPRSIADNIAIMFTMVANPMSFNFQLESLPDSLRKSETYTLDNPIALMKRYKEFEQKPAYHKQLPKLKKMVMDAHNAAEETFEEFFDWLDKRTVQPTSAIVELYDRVCTIDHWIQNALARINNVSEKKRDVEKIRANLSKSTQATDEFETIMKRPVKTQVTTPSHNTLCSRPDCYSNCHIQCQLDFSLDPEIFKDCAAMDNERCNKCEHPASDHRHFNSIWEDTIDTQVIVDENAKQKFHAASKDKNKYQCALIGIQIAIRNLDSQIESLKVEIGNLCHSYQSLSLSGSFAGQIAKSVRLFELNLEALQAGGADPQTIRTMEESIETMRRKEKLVDEAAAATRSQICRPQHWNILQGAIFSYFSLNRLQN